MEGGVSCHRMYMHLRVKSVRKSTLVGRVSEQAWVQGWALESERESVHEWVVAGYQGLLLG
jgi:hypothetical protein